MHLVAPRLGLNDVCRYRLGDTLVFTEHGQAWVWIRGGDVRWVYGYNPCLIWLVLVLRGRGQSE